MHVLSCARLSQATVLHPNALLEHSQVWERAFDVTCTLVFQHQRMRGCKLDSRVGVENARLKSRGQGVARCRGGRPSLVILPGVVRDQQPDRGAKISLDL